MKINGKSYLNVYKEEWVWVYAGTIKGTAEAYNVPEYLLAGVAYIEVGGMPSEVDPLVYNARQALPFGRETPDKTSFGYLSMQFGVAAKTVGYDPDRVSPAARGAIIDSLMDPQQNIALTAKHLSDFAIHLSVVMLRLLHSGQLISVLCTMVAVSIGKHPQRPIMAPSYSTAAPCWKGCWNEFHRVNR